jgi:hypothetical protein
MKRIAIGIMMVAGLWLSTAVVRGSVIAVNFDASVNHLDGTTALVPLYKNPIMFARDLCCRHRWENDPLL